MTSLTMLLLGFGVGFLTGMFVREILVTEMYRRRGY